MPDTSYGGKLTPANNGHWRLEILVDFDGNTDMPTSMVVADKLSYSIHKVSARSTVPLPSPDGNMTLVPSEGTFKDTTYLIIVEGYKGWDRTPTDPTKQYFLQAGELSGTAAMKELGTFSLRFQLASNSNATNLELCYAPEHDLASQPQTEDIGFLENIPGENAVIAHNLTKLGYYGLMQK